MISGMSPSKSFTQYDSQSVATGFKLDSPFKSLMPGASMFGGGISGAPSMAGLPSMFGNSPGDKTGLSMMNPSLRQMAGKGSARTGILSVRSRP